jgi:P27 family predicted phage terminase small subunit
MGKRGPPPTPTRKLELRGSWRAQGRSDEPQPEPGAPEKPEGLSEEASRAWDLLVPQLEATGVITKEDGAAFQRYVAHWATWVQLQAFIDKTGHAHPMRNPRGEVTGVKVYPQVRLAIQLSEHLLRLEQQFGLTPAARAQFARPGGDPEEEGPYDHYFRPVQRRSEG